jgi:hypothetical protein
MDMWGWDAVIRERDEVDPYADLRKVRDENRSLVEERDRLRKENTLLRNASWRLMVAANDVDLGRSIHNSRKPADVIEGPVWVILRKASAEVRAALKGDEE